MTDGPRLAAPPALLALLEDPAVTDVLVNGAQSVWVDGSQGLRQVALELGDAHQVRLLATRLAVQGGGRLDDACPAADVHLPGGVRLHAVLPPVAPDGPLLSFRVLRREAFTLGQLVAAGTMPPACADLIEALISARANFLISGATGAGKTTLLAAVLGLVPPTERIVVIEEAAEISTPHPHCVRLEARTANTEGHGAFGLTALARQALRMRPDRIVVGECRGAEVRELLTALNTGHEGSCGTIHANSAADVPARLTALGSLAGLDRDTVAVQAAAALAAVVHVRRATGQAVRQIESVAAIGLEQGRLVAAPAVTVQPSGLVRGPAWDWLAARCGWS
ncbi:MAG: TadA family conjugal transfer-associated ATPase [Bifidobacteriaceae bacterium]|nr:TadA family conjugal transfer-associated ATPase [Bifidobacteriaceae bacterium]